MRFYSFTGEPGHGGHWTRHPDLTALTPLPSVAYPRVMFDGVLTARHRAAFALHTGAAASGPGSCRPDRANCAVILLAAGQTEDLRFATASGLTALSAGTAWRLRVIRITAITTHSATTAKAAYERHSAAGLCALALGDPDYYNAENGTAQTADVASLCQDFPDATPFPGAVSGS